MGCSMMCYIELGWTPALVFTSLHNFLSMGFKKLLMYFSHDKQKYGQV